MLGLIRRFGRYLHSLCRMMRDIPFKCFGSREIGADSVAVQLEMDLLVTRYLILKRLCFHLDGL